MPLADGLWIRLAKFDRWPSRKHVRLAVLIATIAIFAALVYLTIFPPSAVITKGIEIDREFTKVAPPVGSTVVSVELPRKLDYAAHAAKYRTSQSARQVATFYRNQLTSGGWREIETAKARGNTSYAVTMTSFCKDDIVATLFLPDNADVHQTSFSLDMTWRLFGGGC